MKKVKWLYCGITFLPHLSNHDTRKYFTQFEKPNFELGSRLKSKVKSMKVCFGPQVLGPIS